MTLQPECCSPSSLLQSQLLHLCLVLPSKNKIGLIKKRTVGARLCPLHSVPQTFSSINQCTQGAYVPLRPNSANTKEPFTSYHCQGQRPPLPQFQPSASPR